MKERPILFSASMVRAILEGRKTQTRRIVKPQPDCDLTSIGGFPGQHPTVLAVRNGMYKIPCKQGKVGDCLWVREMWRVASNWDSHAPRSLPGCLDVRYLADEDPDLSGRNRPSIYMPRWASRITLKVTEIRVERVQDITRGVCMEEGCPFANMTTNDPVGWYSDLWDSINGPGSWEVNPWVWVISFKRR